MEIQVEISNLKFLSDLMETPSEIKTGSQVNIPGGATLTLNQITGYKAFDMGKVIEFALNFGSGVSASLIASWLYQKFNGNVTNIRINRREIHFNKGEIEKIITEEIEL